MQLPEGPSFTEEGKNIPYKDIIELRAGGKERVLRSIVPTADGEWQEFMSVTYTRRG